MAQAAIYDFSGRHAIVTGGAAGIGEAIVARLLGAGARVSIWDRDLAALESAQSRLGTQVQAVQVDVSDERSVANAVNVSHAWGTRIDILVNSAGITGPNTTVIDYPVEEWDRVFAINMRGTFLTCKHVAAVMRQAAGGEGYGRIVNIGSSAFAGYAGNCAYGASKGGVFSLTRALAADGAAGDAPPADCASAPKALCAVPPATDKA